VFGLPCEEAYKTLRGGCNEQSIDVFVNSFDFVLYIYVSIAAYLAVIGSQQGLKPYEFNQFIFYWLALYRQTHDVSYLYL